MINYWKKYYSEHPEILSPSSFALFCTPYVYGNILDLGCGSGRDSYHFGLLGKEVLGIDLNVLPSNKDNVTFKECSFKEIDIENYNTVYCRFFLHAISNEDIDYLINKTSNYFMVECRSKGDEPLLFPNHFRNFINGNELLNKLLKNGFEILFYQKAKGLAKYKDEDPLIIRIIARK